MIIMMLDETHSGKKVFIYRDRIKRDSNLAQILNKHKFLTFNRCAKNKLNKFNKKGEREKIERA